MTGPVWDIAFLKQFNDARDKYEKKLYRQVVSSSLERDDPAEKFEIAAREMAIFNEFVDALTFFRDNALNPATLSPAIDEDKNQIPNFFWFRRRSWNAYFYRHPTSNLVRGVLLFHERDRPKELKNALEMAKSLL